MHASDSPVDPRLLLAASNGNSEMGLNSKGSYFMQKEIKRSGCLHARVN